MKLLINRRQNLSAMPTEAILEHNGETIGWNVSLFDKPMGGGDYDIFEQINEYWSTRSEQEQDQIFQIYKQIRELFDLDIDDLRQLTSQLYQLVAKLYEHHDLDTIEHWRKFRSNLLEPPGLKEQYVDSYDMPGTRERTYTLEDYRWLVTLSVSLRPMIPVWGEYIATTKSKTGTVFKEYYAFKLLAYSSVYRSEPMEKLRVYVEHSLPADKSKAAAILGGISSEDFPLWLLGLVIVRRLSVGDVRGIIPDSNLIADIYKYIGQKVKGHDTSFIGLVKDKIIDGQGQDSESNLSKLEGYKIKQEIPEGEIAILEFYMQNVHNIARLICPDIDLKLVDESLVSVQALANAPQILNPQIYLVQSVLKQKQIMPTQGILHLHKTLSLNAIAVTQALLWHRGYFELAALVSAIEQPNVEELYIDAPRARITKEQLEILDKLYPFSRRPVGKQKVAKRINPAVEAIESMANLFSQYNWRLTLPQEWINQLTGNKNIRRYAVPHDIRPKLANLAIAIEQRSF